MKRTPAAKFKTYKSGAAPFFFFIDIFPLENSVLPQPRLSALVDSIKNNSHLIKNNGKNEEFNKFYNIRA